jgi:hypothetical protein
MFFRLLEAFGSGTPSGTGGLICGTPGLHATVRGTPGMEEC